METESVSRGDEGSEGRHTCGRQGDAELDPLEDVTLYQMWEAFVFHCTV